VSDEVVPSREGLFSAVTDCVLDDIQTGTVTYSAYYKVNLGGSVLPEMSCRDMKLTTHVHLVPR
jgi:hypothetical protein